MKKNNKGFSLVELIVVIAIMAILAAVAIPTFAHFITKAHESSDAELLHNINYIFNASCLENGIDVKDVTAAEWDKTNKCVINVKVNGVDNDKIEESFVLHFGEMAKEEFYYIEDLWFDVAKHEFVDAAGVTDKTFTFGNTTITISAKDYAILSGDNAFSNRGSEALLGDVGTLENLLETGIGNDVLTSVKQSDEFLWAIGSYAGMIQGENESDDEYLDRVAAYVDDPNNADAVYSAQIMFAASNAADANDDQLNSLFTGTVTSNIEVKKDGVTDYNATMANAALAYGMYTAYLQRNPNIDPESHEGNFTNVVNSTAFNTYYNSPEGKADLQAYMAAMNMIGDNTENPDVTGSILENGIADNEELAQLMKDIMGK